MSTNPRQLALLEVMQSQGSVTVEYLAEKLGVTLQTVRRDVQRLATAAVAAVMASGLASLSYQVIELPLLRSCKSASQWRIECSVSCPS